MKALTLTQPWATLLLAPRLDTGLPSKTVESRSWTQVGARGKRIGIHAGVGINPALRDAISDGVLFRDPYRSALLDAGYAPLDPWNRRYDERFAAMEPLVDRGQEPLKRLTLGAMLGAVTIAEIVSGTEIIFRRNVRRNIPGTPNLSALELQLGQYDETNGRRFGWVTQRARLLREPVVCRGFQQLWEIPSDVEADMQREGIL